MSAVNAMGRTTAEVLSALDAGRSGLAAPTSELPLPTVVGAVPGDLPPPPPALARYDTRLSRIGLAALREIEGDVARALSRWGKRRVAILVGTSTGGLDATEMAYRHFASERTLPSSFDLHTQHDFNALGELYAAVLGSEGPVYVVSSACSSSGKVHASAARLIAAGLVDAALVGGIDSLCRMTLHGFRGLGILSETPCRPFSSARNGINIGEGAALMLLERESASDLAVLGVGESSDAYNMSSPEPTGRGAREAMERALAGGHIAPGDVGVVLAHGTATPQNDLAESAAITDVLGTSVPVISTKGYTGHQLGAAGATGAVFAAHVVRTGRIPPSLGAEPLDPAIPVRVATHATTTTARVVLANAFAFGGSNVSLAIGRVSAPPGANEARATRPVYLTGVGFWAKGFADLDALLRGEPDLGVTDCTNPWVPSRLGRGTSLLTRMLGEVAAQACVRGGADPATCATVYGSALGEFETMVTLLDAIFRGDGQVSPMRFKNSVHNAASGLGSIGQGNRAFSTALAAGTRTFEASMIEAIALMTETGGDVIVSVADDALPPPFAALAPRAGLGVGLCLRSERPATGAIARIEGLRQSDDRVAPPTTVRGRAIPDGLRANPTVSALALLDAALSGTPTTVALAHDAPRPFVLDVTPA